MTWPEWMQVVIRVGTFVLLMFLVPQAIGLGLLHRFWSRGWPVRIALALVPAVSCFITSLIYWNVWADRMEKAGDYPCGMFGAAAVWSTLTTVALNVPLGLCMMMVMFAQRRRVNSLKQHAAC